MITGYNDISPRTEAYAVRDLLERGMPFLVFENFGQSKALPAHNSTQMVWRRYLALDPTPNELIEGVTPVAKRLTKQDVPHTLKQYGDLVEITDIVADTHEDPVFSEAREVLGEQQAIMIENVRFGALKAGSNVYYGNGVQRSDVNTPMTKGLQQKIVRFLKNQYARPITKVITSNPDYGTKSVAPAYIAVCHTDLEPDLELMSGWKPIEDYGSHMTPFESEMGACGPVRYIGSQICSPWEDAGGAAGTGASERMSTSGTNADVYPALYFGKDAYGITALKGMFAARVLVRQPRPDSADPLAQRGSVGWKSMQGAVILNDAWMNRGEVAATLNPNA